MDSRARQRQTRFLRLAMAAAAAAIWLAGGASADPIAPATAAAIGSGAYSISANAQMSLGVHLFVGALLLIGSACLAWLLYLMITCPPEDEDRTTTGADTALRTPADPPSAGMAALLRLWPGSALPYSSAGGGDSLTRMLTRLIRTWISARLGHPGPM